MPLHNLIFVAHNVFPYLGDCKKHFTANLTTSIKSRNTNLAIACTIKAMDSFLHIVKSCLQFINLNKIYATRVLISHLLHKEWLETFKHMLPNIDTWVNSTESQKNLMYTQKWNNFNMLLIYFHYYSSSLTCWDVDAPNFYKDFMELILVYTTTFW